MTSPTAAAVAAASGVPLNDSNNIPNQSESAVN
jgi:hypothetical protein